MSRLEKGHNHISFIISKKHSEGVGRSTLCVVSAVCAIALLVASSFSMPLVLADQEILRVGNNLVEILFKAQASLGIVSVRNGVTGTRYSFSGSPIFSIVLFDKTTNRQILLSASDAAHFNYQLLDTGRVLVAEYRGFRTTEGFFRINVELTVAVSDGPEAVFSIRVENEERADVYYVMYPVIDGISKLGGRKESTFLVIPSWTGGLVVGDPSRFCCPGHPAHPYPTGEQNLQFMSLFDSEGAGSLYMYTNDTKGLYKSFKWEGKGDVGLMSVLHYPELGDTRTYALPYSVVLGVSDARDWRSAVKPYKEWASAQWWARYTRRSSWLTDVHLVVYSTAYLPGAVGELQRNVGFRDIVDAARELRRKTFLYNRTILFLISGWEKNGHCTSYPDVFPPKEGWDELRKLVDELHEMNFRVGFFILGSFLMLTNGRPELEGYRYIIKDIYGKPYQFSQEFVFLDPATQYWKSALVNISVSLVRNTGVDLLYFDTVPHSPVNYAASQEHPVGGGNYTVGAWIEIFKEIRERTVDVKPDLALVTEGLTEPLIPFVDGTFLGGAIFFTPLGINFEADVEDFFSEIYGNKVVKLGWWVPQREQSSLVYYRGYMYRRRQPIDDTYTYFLISRAFLYGFPIPLGGFHQGGFDRESIDLFLHDEKLLFIEKLAFARSHYLRSFLVEGRLLEKGGEGDEIVLSHPRGEGVSETYPTEIALRPVQYSVWSNAQGDVARVYVNAWNRPVTLHVRRSDADIVLIDGFPTVIPESGTINVMPKSLVVIILLRDRDASSYLKILRESTLAHMAKLLRGLRELYRVSGNTSFLENIFEEVAASRNYTQEYLSHQADRFRKYYETVYKEGYSTSALLEVVIEYTARLGGCDFFGALNFDDAVILPTLNPPVFTSGNGVAYLSFRPMLIGYPHWVRTDERLGYHVVVFPTYSFNSSLEERNVVRVLLRLAIPPGRRNILVEVSAGEYWHPEPEIRVLIRNVLTNKTILSVSQEGGGWRTYSIPVEDVLLKQQPRPSIVVDAVVDKSQVRPGEAVTVSITVSNAGDAAVAHNLTLTVNNEAKKNWVVLLNPGESRSLSYVLSFQAEGTYYVRVGGKTFTIAVSKPPPARFEVSGLSISPDSVKLGELSTVTVTVRNTGGDSGSYEVVLRVDSQVVDTKVVFLCPNQSIAVNFTYMPTREGTLIVDVNGLTGSLTVSRGENLWIPILGAVAVVTVLVLLTLSLRRKPAGRFSTPQIR